MITRSLWNRDPFAELERMVDQVDRAFDTFFRPSNMGAGGMVPVDIYEKDDSLFVCAAVPGVNPDELEVTVDENVLTIRGEIKQNWETTDDTRVYRREHRYGAFTRSIRLPEGLDLDHIDAQFNNGFVTIRLPKVVQHKPEPKRIQVRTADQPQALTQNTPSAERNGRHKERETAGSR